jgi:hypothetical protein
VTFLHEGAKYHGGAGHYPNGDIGEVFLKGGKTGHLLEALASDGAVAASIALQYGCPIEVLQQAFLRTDSGEAAGPMGKLFDILAGRDAET